MAGAESAVIEGDGMDRDLLIEHLTTALRAITTPRFYETERGFQGELLVGLQRAIPQGFLPDRVIIEQEYQKGSVCMGSQSGPISSFTNLLTRIGIAHVETGMSPSWN